MTELETKADECQNIRHHFVNVRVIGILLALGTNEHHCASHNQPSGKGRCEGRDGCLNFPGDRYSYAFTPPIKYDWTPFLCKREGKGDMVHMRLARCRARTFVVGRFHLNVVEICVLLFHTWYSSGVAALTMGSSRRSSSFFANLVIVIDKVIVLANWTVRTAKTLIHT